MNQNINIGLITKQISNNKRKINKKQDDSDDENQTKIAVYDFFSKIFPNNKVLSEAR